jgi:hypothetical protein
MLPNILSLKNLFNEIKPVAYSEFLEDLGKQVLLVLGAQFPCFDWLSIPKVCGIEVRFAEI